MEKRLFFCKFYSSILKYDNKKQLISRRRTEEYRNDCNKRSFYHEGVSDMQSGMITFMAVAAENRDDNTGGHIKRTAKYVEGIARELKRRGL